MQSDFNQMLRMTQKSAILLSSHSFFDALFLLLNINFPISASIFVFYQLLHPYSLHCFDRRRSFSNWCQTKMLHFNVPISYELQLNWIKCNKFRNCDPFSELSHNCDLVFVSVCSTQQSNFAQSLKTEFLGIVVGNGMLRDKGIIKWLQKDNGSKKDK